MDPDVLCPQKADKSNLSLSLLSSGLFVIAVCGSISVHGTS